MARVQLDPTAQAITYDSDGTNGFAIGEDQYNTNRANSPVAAGGLLNIKRILGVLAAGPNIATTGGASGADITLPGAQPGDVVIVQPTGTTANPTVSLKGFVKSAGVVSVTGTISVAGAVDLSAAGSIIVVVIGLS